MLIMVGSRRSTLSASLRKCSLMSSGISLGPLSTPILTRRRSCFDRSRIGLIRYYDSEMAGHGALRVINEDRVEPTRGFGQHRHSEMEIFSYIVSGELEQ